MATVFFSPVGNGWQFFDANGKPLNGGFLNTYAAGTTTPTATYTTKAGTIQNANPIQLGSDGRPANEIWLLAATGYKFVLTSSVSVAIPPTLDDIYGINDPTTNNAIGYTGATISGALIMNLAPINEAQGANVPVVAAVNLTNTTGNYVWMTGTGTVTSIQLAQGYYREVEITNTTAFQNSAQLIMLGGASVTANPGDVLGFRGEATPNVRNVMFQRANGSPITLSGLASATQTFLAADLTISQAYVDIVSTSTIGNVGQVWLITSIATLTDRAGSANINHRIWDGTNVFIETSNDIRTANAAITSTVQAVVLPSGPTVYKSSAVDTTSVTGAALRSALSITNNKATSIIAQRII